MNDDPCHWRIYATLRQKVAKAWIVSDKNMSPHMVSISNNLLSEPPSKQILVMLATPLR